MDPYQLGPCKHGGGRIRYYQIFIVTILRDVNYEEVRSGDDLLR